MNDQYQPIPIPALQAELLDPNNFNNQIYLPAVPDGKKQESGPNLGVEHNRNDLKYNTKFCLLVLLMYVGKLAVSAYVLVETDSCKDIKSIWVILMVVHDVVESLSIIAKISVLLKIRSGSSNILTPIELHPDLRTELQQNLEENTKKRPRADATVLRFIDRITALNTLYYFGIFIFGQVLLYFYFDQTCCPYDKVMWDLMLAYIILGYVWIFWPVLLAILLCFCFPFILLIGRSSRSE